MTGADIPNDERVWHRPLQSPYVWRRYDADAGVWLARLGEEGEAPLLYSQAETRPAAITALWSAAFLWIKVAREQWQERQIHAPASAASAAPEPAPHSLDDASTREERKP